MRRWIAKVSVRKAIAVAASAGVVAISLPYVKSHTASFFSGLSKKSGGAKTKRDVSPPALAELDLTRIDARGDVVTAPAHGDRVANLTLVPKYQRAANRMLRDDSVPMGAVVMTDVRTSRVLV